MRQYIKAGWIKARIMYHRRKADAYSKPVIRSHKRDGYTIWMHTMALRHTMKARMLERELPLGKRLMS